ncbi:Calcium-binding EF hand family protein [Zea mays]|uniref:Calcium-binding EF hand family protein n=1 Tax=Zea mays TaxID=4577 RepID=K7TXN5_MAIZE|nr:Calcium-binding EF hand family protein [Zea mays]
MAATFRPGQEPPTSSSASACPGSRSASTTPPPPPASRTSTPSAASSSGCFLPTTTTPAGPAASTPSSAPCTGTSARTRRWTCGSGSRTCSRSSTGRPGASASASASASWRPGCAGRPPPGWTPSRGGRWLRTTRTATVPSRCASSSQFASADRDGDGSLNAVEFNDFLHPEDSSQESVMLWLLKDKLSEMDHDGDGRLSQEEFVAQSHIIISGARHADDGGHAHDLERAEAAKKFTELDADKDNYLTVEEARCVLQSLVTGEFSYATSHAKFLMKVVASSNRTKLM